MNVALSSLLTVMVCSQTPADRHQTANFVVHAETPEVAKMVAEAAEAHRKDLATLWIGKDLPAWSHRCRINVAVTMDAPQAFTDLSYSQGRVVAQKVEIKGALDEIVRGPLPHELTHVLFGHHFGLQVPRWADEGAAVLSEDKHQWTLQRRAFADILAAEKHFPLRTFLAMREYPDDVHCLYAQGHSVSRFLVSAKGRQVFLAFVSDGMKYGWDEAVRARYAFKDVEHLEKEWLDSLKAPREMGRELIDPNSSLKRAHPIEWAFTHASSSKKSLSSFRGALARHRV